MKRHRASQANTNVGDTRKIFPGFTGTGGLGELSKGMFEGEESSYEERDLLEEKKIHNLNYEVTRLIENLENSELKKNEIQTQ